MAKADTFTERPGGFWVRFAAQTIDNLVLGIPVGMLEGAAYVAVLAMAGKITPAAGALVPLGAFALTLLVNLVYFTWMTARDGQTLGKKLFHLKVLRMDGKPMDVPHALGRAFGYWISSIPLLLGYLIAPFSQERRALHDYVAHTRVVRTKANPAAVEALVWIIPVLSSLLVVFMIGIMAAVAIPKFAVLKARADEGATKGGQSAMISGLAFYYRDHRGHWPAHLEELLAGGQDAYLKAIPEEKITHSVRVVTTYDGKGGWLYNAKTGWVTPNVDGIDKEGVAYKDYGKPTPKEKSAL